jgi:hypothetical protein
LSVGTGGPADQNRWAVARSGPAAPPFASRNLRNVQRVPPIVPTIARKHPAVRPNVAELRPKVAAVRCNVVAVARNDRTRRASDGRSREIVRAHSGKVRTERGKVRRDRRNVHATVQGLRAASEWFVATVASFVGTVGRTRALPGGDGGARAGRGLPVGVAVSSAGRYVGCQRTCWNFLLVMA